MKKKVIYIISDINRALAFEWIAAYLDKDTIDLSFILLNPGDSVLEQHLVEKGMNLTRIHCAGKATIPGAWLKLYSLLRKQKPDIIHCHLQKACMLGLPASRLAGIRTRIHTRHHSSLHHVYFPKGVFWDKWYNKLSTYIIAISGEVKKILVEWEKVPGAKVKYIPHGFLLNEFQNADPVIVSRLKDKYELGTAYPVIGVVSRYTEWKGIQYTIPAFKELLKQYPDAVLLLFNAGGDYEKEINLLLADLPQNSFRAIPFEPNISAAYHLMNICVHVPIDEHSEAFGQIYIEAMASGVPLLATLSGIGNDILQHKKNAWVVPHKDSSAIADGIQNILSDAALKQTLVKNASETAKQFSLQKMIDSLNNLYANA